LDKTERSTVAMTDKPIDNRDVLMDAFMALLEDAIREGATPYDVVSTMLAVITNVIGALKPDAREEAAALITSKLHLGVNYEATIAAKEAKAQRH
jgi:hypothetical protein